MSGQLQSHRWSDKPFWVRQAIGAVLIILTGLFCYARFVSKTKKEPKVHTFVQSHKDQKSADEVTKKMAQSGILSAFQEIAPHHGISRGVGSGPAAKGANVQERPLFDGLLVRLEVELMRPLSSASGDSSAEVSVLSLVPSPDTADLSLDGLESAKLVGNFQPNFETGRMSFEFRQLITPSGKSYSVAAIGIDPEDEQPAIRADYSSGLASRILGSTLGTAINLAQEVTLSHVIQNPQDRQSMAMEQMNQAFTQGTSQAAASISDAATRDLRNAKPVLTMKAGKRFRVQLRSTSGGSP